MINVLYVFCSTNFSGAEIVMERLILKNEEVNAICLCPPGEFADRLKMKGIVVVEENALTSLDRNNVRYSKLILLLIVLRKISRINYRVVKILAQNRIQIIHGNNLGAAFYILPLRITRFLFSPKLKCIWSNHDLSYPNGKQSEFLARTCVRFFNRTIVVSQAVKNKFPKSYADRIEVLYNGLDSSVFAFDLNKRRNFRISNNILDKEIAIGIIGLISERKGHHLLINQFFELSKKHIGLKLLIIGRFNSSEKKFQELISKEIEKFGNTKIQLKSHTDNIVEAYCGLDIVVNCSLPLLSEPLGTTIYEAMACERIVLASDTGGSPEIVSDNDDGFLFKAGDENDLYRKIDYIIREDYLILKQMQIRARKKAIEKFSIDKMKNNYNLILNKL